MVLEGNSLFQDMYMVKCRICGKDNEEGYSFCQDCGARLEQRPGTLPKESLGADSGPGRMAASALAASGDSSPLSSDEEQSTSVLSNPIASIPSSVRVPVIPVSASSSEGEKRVTREPTSPRIPVVRPAPGDLQVCRYCGAEVSSVYTFCGLCGRSFAPGHSEVPGKMGVPLKEEKRKTFSAMIIRIREDETQDFCFTLRPGENLVGREMGDLIFSTDSLLSRRHLRITVEGNKVILEDLGSTNGTYLRLHHNVSLQNGDYILIGRQILRFDVLEGKQKQEASDASNANQTMMLGSLQPAGQARLVKQLMHGQNGNEYPLTEDCTTIGREAGDIAFRNDPFVSAQHARILKQKNIYMLEDLNSSKGTYIRLQSPKEVGNDDYFVIGNQLFQVKAG